MTQRLRTFAEVDLTDLDQASGGKFLGAYATGGVGVGLGFSGATNSVVLSPELGGGSGHTYANANSGVGIYGLGPSVSAGFGVAFGWSPSSTADDVLAGGSKGVTVGPFQGAWNDNGFRVGVSTSFGLAYTRGHTQRIDDDPSLHADPNPGDGKDHSNDAPYVQQENWAGSFSDRERAEYLDREAAANPLARDAGYFDIGQQEASRTDSPAAAYQTATNGDDPDALMWSGGVSDVPYTPNVVVNHTPDGGRTVTAADGSDEEAATAADEE